MTDYITAKQRLTFPPSLLTRVIIGAVYGIFTISVITILIIEATNYV